MNARLEIIWRRGRRDCRGIAAIVIVLASAVPGSNCLAASFVYETATEFISNGDFDGDGRIDALVLDKATGNARVGYQDANGALTWASPVPTGVPQAGAMAVGRLSQTNRDPIAVASVQWNRIHILDVSSPSNSPVVVSPAHVGMTMLVGLDAPYDTNATRGWLVAGAISENNPGVTLLDLFAFTGDSVAQFQDQIAAEGQLTSGNGLQLGAAATTYIGAIARGSNDTFAAYSYRDVTNELFRVEVHAGSEYAFGRFQWGQDTEATPGLLFYVPGQSNITVHRVLETAGVFTLSTPTITSFTSAIQRVYYVDEGTNGFAVVRFGDGAVGVRPASDSDELHIDPALGLGAAGNVTGVVPLGPGRFALLSSGSNSFSSVQSQVFTKSGSNYVQTSASAVSPVSTSRTRANVWFFASEPFVNARPAFIASLSGSDWIDSISGLPGTVSAITETDGGVTNGLGNPTMQNLGSSPNNAPYGIASQYHPTISLFSYSSPRAAQLIQVTISPPAGTYSDPVNVAFTTGDPTDHVSYRVGTSGAFQQYGSPFTISSNAQVQYYATRFGFPDPTPIEAASYTITGGVIPPLNTNTNGGTNVPPIVNPSNAIPTYPYGTVFYSRRSGSTGSIWAIHLDGSGDQYITEGVRPRLSPDGRYLAFLREGDPFATIPVNNGNIWIRDLLTGAESRLITHTNLIVGFDWEYGNTNLVFDHGCGLFRAGLDGVVTAVAFGADCADDAPMVSPVDGSLAFHNLSGASTNVGIYVTDPAVTAKQKLNLGVLKPRRPAWSPDGRQLAFAHYQFTYIPESGEDLYVVNSDGTDLFQITGFPSVEGFREGALWTPDGDALIGAATVGGVNGIWLVPLTSDRHACGSPPVRLPTTAGDLIDYVGTVFTPPPPPKLFIRREQNEVIVSWRRTAWPYVLETAAEPVPAGSWLPMNGPYSVTNGLFEKHIPAGDLQSAEFFRLKRP